MRAHAAGIAEWPVTYGSPATGRVPALPTAASFTSTTWGGLLGGMAHATNRHWLNPALVGKGHTYINTPGEPILPCISDFLSNMPVPRPYGLADQGAIDNRWQYVRDLEGRDFCSISHLMTNLGEVLATTTFHGMLTGRLRVLSQKDVQYVAVRDVDCLLCPIDHKPLVKLRYACVEPGRSEDIDWSRTVYRCATCALLTSPAGSRFSVSMGLNTEEALFVMD